MKKDRAAYWTGVSILLGAGLLVGQVAAIMVGATAALSIAMTRDGITF